MTYAAETATLTILSMKFYRRRALPGFAAVVPNQTPTGREICSKCGLRRIANQEQYALIRTELEHYEDFRI